MASFLCVASKGEESAYPIISMMGRTFIIQKLLCFVIVTQLAKGAYKAMLHNRSQECFL